MAHLTVSGKSVVYKKIEAGVHTLKMNGYLTLQILLGKVYRPHVKTAGVFHGYVRGIKGEGILYVGVMGRIVAASQGVLPAEGNRKTIEALGAKVLGKKVGHLNNGGGKAKIPFTAQGAETVAVLSVACESGELVAVGDQITARRLAAYVKMIEGLMIRLGKIHKSLLSCVRFDGLRAFKYMVACFTALVKIAEENREAKFASLGVAFSLDRMRILYYNR